MPQVFVHGVPENAALWSPLFDELRSRGVEDLIALSPPGFGAPLPSGFQATRIGYRSWLVDALEQLGGGIDLVGHDWGALHVYGLLAERPDLIRSWAADVAGSLHPDYVWHDMAQVWQTPGAGEQAIEEMFGLPEAETARLLTEFDLPMEHAVSLASCMDDTMGRCILSLYRSAAQPVLADLGRELAAGRQPPGMVLLATDDPYPGTHAMNEAVADSLGASVCRLEGRGHWWMFDGAVEVADSLVDHWGRAGTAS